jgi:hypothetical protein
MTTLAFATAATHPFATMRKTAKDVLASAMPDEIHEWLWNAKIDELRDFLRLVKREEHWGVHGRDALDICVAKASYRASVWMIVVTVATAIMTAAVLLFTYWLWQDAKTAKRPPPHRQRPAVTAPPPAALSPSSSAP